MRFRIDDFLDLRSISQSCCSGFCAEALRKGIPAIFLAHASVSGIAVMRPSRRVQRSIFTVLFIVLLIARILGWGVLHVTGALIHFLLVVALISLVLHFIRGPRPV